jgi:hypothetical protein
MVRDLTAKAHAIRSHHWRPTIDYSNLAGYLNNLGNRLESRYERTGDMTGPQDDDASSKATPFNEDYDRQDENSLPESSLRIGRHRSESNSVQTLHDPTLEQKLWDNIWRKGFGLFLSQIIVYMRRWLRPSVSNGFRRVQWTCVSSYCLSNKFEPN